MSSPCSGVLQLRAAVANTWPGSRWDRGPRLPSTCNTTPLLTPYTPRYKDDWHVLKVAGRHALSSSPYSPKTPYHTSEDVTDQHRLIHRIPVQSVAKQQSDGPCCMRQTCDSTPEATPHSYAGHHQQASAKKHKQPLNRHPGKESTTIRLTKGS